MPYETLSEDETRKFHELQKIDNLSGCLGSDSGSRFLVRKTADSGEKITRSQICQTEFTEKMKKIPANPLTK